jgi:hypothetical protein
MPQVFHPSMNAVARATIAGAIATLGAVGVAAFYVDRSSWMTHQGVVREQPVPFSHRHHYRDLGIDCRYCHTSVTRSGFAGLPPTKTCMTCHSRVWTDAAILAPVRESWAGQTPIKWNRVHNLPDFAYFPHDIHVNKGIGCVSCHGRVDQMPIMLQANTLQMSWCLDCHRHPERHLRPRDQVFNMEFVIDDKVKREYSDADRQVTDQETLGRALIERYHIPTDGRLTNCYTCHR